MVGSCCSGSLCCSPGQCSAGPTTTSNTRLVPAHMALWPCLHHYPRYIAMFPLDNLHTISTSAPRNGTLQEHHRHHVFRVSCCIWWWQMDRWGGPGRAPPCMLRPPVSGRWVRGHVQLIIRVPLTPTKVMGGPDHQPCSTTRAGSPWLPRPCHHDLDKDVQSTTVPHCQPRSLTLLAPDIALQGHHWDLQQGFCPPVLRGTLLVQPHVQRFLGSLRAAPRCSSA